MKSASVLLVTFSVLLVWSSGKNNGAAHPAAAADAPNQTHAAQLLHTFDPFHIGLRNGGVAALPSGLTLADGAAMGTYLSPILHAPIPFNALFTTWQSSEPATSGLILTMRTAQDNAPWSDWQVIAANEDFTPPDATAVTGDMVTVPAVDVRHTRLQYHIQMSSPQPNAAPTLHWLRFTFIDSTHGPRAADMRPVTSNTPDADFPKPPVVPRWQWCIDPACNYNSGLEYVSVTHLVVHHTVTGSGVPDWPSTVRAIWFYHAFNNNWGDIGYNYVIDPNGVIYEGHLGGDDVVGTHAGNANHGSMGAALIGDYSNVDPNNSMVNALANLLAWKADQKGIDVFSASRLPQLGACYDPVYNEGGTVCWGLPHLMGHRDVFGGLNTQCPGEHMHDLLPWLRQQVADRIGFVSPYTYVEEWLNGADTPIFTKSNANWHNTLDEAGGCGSNRHAYFTFSVTDPNQSSNWATYRPDITYSGVYELQAYAPYCNTGRAETNGARYQVHHAHGVSTVVVSHEANVGLWMNLGTYELRADNSGYIYLSDLTSSDAGLGVWFDAIRLRLLGATATNVSPTSNAWVTQRVVTFQWNVINMPNLSTVTLQVATDAAFTNLLVNQTMPATNQSSITFTQDYARLYWRVRATATDNSQVISAATSFGVDTGAPTSAVYAVLQMDANSFLLYWSGVDAVSGVSGYNIEYRAEGETVWTPWRSQTTNTNGRFIRPDSRVYWFRSQAVDNAGILEPPHTTADLDTNGAPLLISKQFLPVFPQQ